MASSSELRMALMCSSSSGWVAFVCLGEIHIPVGPFRTAAASALALHFHHMAGLHLEDAGKGRAAGHHRLHQLVEQAFGGEVDASTAGWANSTLSSEPNTNPSLVMASSTGA